VDIVIDSDNHQTLEAAVIAAGLANTLAGEGPFTLFAPTDTAFQALGSQTLERLLLEQYRKHLVDLLLYHVFSGRITSVDLNEGDVPSLSGEIVAVTLDPVAVNGATVTAADLVADNGVVHVIDSVRMLG
jgi:uncharacterized surface protein with fasciclin (FAS1) repeats